MTYPQELAEYYLARVEELRAKGSPEQTASAALDALADAIVALADAIVERYGATVLDLALGSP